MKRGDKFIISKQLGNVLLHRPESNVAEVKYFLSDKVVVQINNKQYVLPIGKFEEYVLEKIEPTKEKPIKIATGDVNKAHMIPEKPPVKPEPTPDSIPEPEPTPELTPDPIPEPEPTPEPDNIIVNPPDPDSDLYDEDYL